MKTPKLSTTAAFTASLVIASACSSAVVATPRTETTYIPGVNGVLRISPENGSVSANIAAPLQAVWHILPIAFDSLGLQLSLVDPKRHVMGNEGIKVRARLGKERLSTYLECGTTQVGPNADSYEVFLTVLTDLRPVKSDSTRTTVTVNLSAAAKPLQFSQDYSRCSSKATFERKLIDVVAASLRK